MKQSPQALLQEMINLFSDPDKVERLEDTVTKTFIDQTIKPSNNWSFSNRMLMTVQGTQDARGFRQWQKIGRNPLDWQKQITILAPRIKKIHDEKKDEDRTIIIGFTTIGLYAIENTYGKKLEDPNETLKLPSLHQVAEHWGINVRYEKINGEWGHFSPGENEIVLGTEDQNTFFHELAHLAHQKIDGKLSNEKERYAEQEAIAQLSASVLSRMFGIKMDNYTFEYIQMYTKEHKQNEVARMCMRVAEKTSKVLDLIMTTKKEIEVIA